MIPLLLVLDDWEGLIEKSPCWQQLSGLAEIKFLKEPLLNSTDPDIGRTTFLMALRERTALNENIFSRMPDLKLILQTGGHAYHIDMDAVKKRDITVELGRGAKVPLISVPELTFGLMLGLVHKIYEGNELLKNGGWDPLTGHTLSGKRLGILGLGRHGSRVAEIASTAFGMEAVAWGRSGASPGPDSIKRLPLDELLSTSDVVSIHLKLAGESTGLLNREKLSLMKPTATLINTARGAIVDEAALADALQNKKIAGAGLDVFAHEPLPTGSPLRKLKNVILTPHIGWTVEEVFEEFAQIACSQLKQYLVHP